MITINAGQSTSFPRIADAIEAAKAYAPMPVTIHIAPGRYHEKLTVSQPHVTLMGDDASNTILTYDDYAREIMPDGIKRGTFRTYTLFLDAPDITLCNLTVENAAGAGKEVGQAIALYAEGEGIRVKNCRLIGSQDTLFTGPLPEKEKEPGGFRGPKEFAPRINGRQYYKNTYICGGVDFIFGSATAYFENCTLESLPEGGGYVTAGSSPKVQTYGYIFNHCRFIGSEPNTCYLGRPWREYAKVVILNSEIGDHIKPEGWHDWGKIDAHDTVCFAEYKNYGPGATGARPSWTHTLTDTEAENYTYASVFS